MQYPSSFGNWHSWKFDFHTRVSKHILWSISIMLNQQVADSSTERAQIQLKIPPFRPSRWPVKKKSGRKLANLLPPETHLSFPSSFGLTRIRCFATSLRGRKATVDIIGCCRLACLDDELTLGKLKWIDRSTACRRQEAKWESCELDQGSILGCPPAQDAHHQDDITF